MKKLLLLLVVLFGTQLFAQETTVSRFKLIPTKNMWIFIKLDTGNGRTWLVQYSTSEDNRLETSLCDKPLVLDPVPPAGRFELYPTENTYNFILLDKDFGTTYQVQWGVESKDRLRVPISEESDVVWSFGYTPRKLLNEWNFKDINGKWLSKDFFRSVFNFNEYGFAVVQRKDGKYNLLSTKGNIQFRQWYDYLSSIYWKDGYMNVRLNGKENLINTQEHTRFTTWYDSIMATYDDGHTIVTKDGKTNCLDKFGKLFCPEWYDRFSFYDQHAIVSKGDKDNVIEVGGRVIGKEWYDIYFAPSEGFCLVKNNGSYNYVNLTSGGLLLSEWCDDAGFFKDGFGKIKKGEDWYKVDKNGEITKIETE